MGHYTGNYSITSRDVSQARLRKTLMRLVRQCQQEKQSGPFYLLGHILLFLNDRTAASITFEQNLSKKDNNLIHRAAYCNRCESRSVIKGYRHVCTSCADVDFCEACFEQFHNNMAFKRCEKHDLVKILRETWNDLKPDCVDENGNTFQMWLAEIYEHYKLML